MSFILDTAAHECVSEDALIHLKSYKYSSVDKSLISKYILRHYMRTSPKFPSSGRWLNQASVEWFRQITSIMARSKYGYPSRVLLHPWKCHMSGNIHARPSRTGMGLLS